MTNAPTDRQEFLRLIQENKGIIFKICHSYCRHKDDREDLAQEIIYQLWRSGQRFNANYKFSTWMYRIALNVAISFYRSERRTQARVSLAADWQFLDPADHPDDTAVMDEKIDRLQQFIRELGELDRALMILYLEERSYREIAEILGITETNVATKLNRIKMGLKQKFSQLEP